MYNEPVSRQPASGNKALVIILCVIGGICLLLIAAAVIGGFAVCGLVKNQFLPLVECSLSFNEVHEALTDYAKDHDGRLPKAETWQDDIKPYFAKIDKMSKSSKDMPAGWKLNKMPVDGLWGCRIGEKGQTGMAFNSELSGVKLADIRNPNQVVMIFEVPSAGKNLAMPYTPQAKDSAPKLMGEPRPWMFVFVSGVNPFGTEGKDFSADSQSMPPATKPDLGK